MEDFARFDVVLVRLDPARGRTSGVSFSRIGSAGSASVTRLALGQNAGYQKPTKVVGVARFERATTCTPYRCATRLRHTPTSASVAKGTGPRHRRSEGARGTSPNPSLARRGTAQPPWSPKTIQHALIGKYELRY